MCVRDKMQSTQAESVPEANEWAKGGLEEALKSDRIVGARTSIIWSGRASLSCIG